MVARQRAPQGPPVADIAAAVGGVLRAAHMGSTPPSLSPPSPSRVRLAAGRSRGSDSSAPALPGWRARTACQARGLCCSRPAGRPTALSCASPPAAAAPSSCTTSCPPRVPRRLNPATPHADPSRVFCYAMCTNICATYYGRIIYYTIATHLASRSLARFVGAAPPQRSRSTPRPPPPSTRCADGGAGAVGRRGAGGR
eukprot:SAG11_NODE_12972_length_676_cov_1.327556_1_plen_197_part_10